MPILESKRHRPAICKTLLATGMGAMFGFQIWRLAEYGFTISIPWPGSAWIFLSQVFLGFSIGVFALGKWWERGSVFGLVFGIPSAVGVHALGLKWAPYGIALITASLAVGLLIAFIADKILPRPMFSNVAASTKPEICPARTLQQRLMEGKVALEQLDAERERRRDPGFGRTVEDRIVWGELVELELQDIDEQLRRICGAAGPIPHGPMKSNLREGGPHEHHDS